MKSLKTMTNVQLSSVAAAAKAEIDHRAAIKKATTEVKSVLKKYNVKLDDITLDRSLTSKSKGSSAKRPKRKTANTSRMRSKVEKPKAVIKNQDRRSVVKPKYKGPLSSQSWSGRGRAPQWVLEICEAEKMSISEFKTDKRFSTF